MDVVAPALLVRPPVDVGVEQLKGFRRGSRLGLVVHGKRSIDFDGREQLLRHAAAQLQAQAGSAGLEGLRLEHGRELPHSKGVRGERFQGLIL